MVVNPKNRKGASLFAGGDYNTGFETHEVPVVGRARSGPGWGRVAGRGEGGKDLLLTARTETF